MNKKIIAKYKLDQIDLLTITECEDAFLILRYLHSRCYDPEETSEIKSYIEKIQARILILDNKNESKNG